MLFAGWLDWAVADVLHGTCTNHRIGILKAKRTNDTALHKILLFSVTNFSVSFRVYLSPHSDISDVRAVDVRNFDFGSTHGERIDTFRNSANGWLFVFDSLCENRKQFRWSIHFAVHLSSISVPLQSKQWKLAPDRYNTRSDIIPCPFALLIAIFPCAGFQSPAPVYAKC